MSDQSPFKCPECDRFIGYIDVKDGVVKIKCPKCKNWVIVMGSVPVIPSERPLVGDVTT